MQRPVRWILVVVATIAFVALSASVIHRQVLALGASDIHDRASLPDHISVCGRDWTVDPSRRATTWAEAGTRFGVQPALVDPLPFAPCPAGPCTSSAHDAPCDTVVLVRVGQDAYVSYELSGGP